MAQDFGGAHGTKLTEAVTRKLCKCLSRGLPRKLACEKAGIDYTTFRQWLDPAKRPEPEFDVFRQRVGAAEADFLDRGIELVMKSEHPTAIVNLMRARFPQYLSERTMVAVEEADKQEADDESPEERRDRIRANLHILNTSKKAS
ncbi:MAG: hypothetical protein OXD40_09470 [bacterium]|nr:hypothetical protein [bacterium]